ncbi:L-Ala-D/L-amino acid epimerase isoform X2 [Cryptomeria japonica]|uniref:L-Ala-D/L-amino acid epimerase isoform X2 n=1 Tax=Cryptomeria japonica TaxID=3369 RepID=UPI0027DA94AD|nr:L-Ala-D/L-amino acid epimerase isoform X2 [Cryptomeria japonica]
MERNQTMRFSEYNRVNLISGGEAKLCSSASFRCSSSVKGMRSDGDGASLSAWKRIEESCRVKVLKAEARPLNVPLLAPFTIASSRVEEVNNVAVRVDLQVQEQGGEEGGGGVGWGESPILPRVTAEDQSLALQKANYAAEILQTLPSKSLGDLLRHVHTLLPGHAFASVRAGVEMAVIDGVANSIGLPLWQIFGGAYDSITTDITIPIVTPAEAAQLAAKYAELGFQTLKLKVGKNLDADIQVLKAIRNSHPSCSFILDANEGYTAAEAIQVLQRLHDMGVTPILFEQPVARDDWDGLGHVSKVAREVYGVSVAADESCRGLLDVQKIVHERLADVINIKLAKVGVLGALEIIELTRKEGLQLMIGGMVETRLAMGFAAHLAAGLGCFKFVDLDTPLLLSDDPVIGGYQVAGPVYRFTNAAGHGGFLDWKEQRDDE